MTVPSLCVSSAPPLGVQSLRVLSPYPQEPPLTLTPDPQKTLKKGYLSPFLPAPVAGHLIFGLVAKNEGHGRC